MKDEKIRAEVEMIIAEEGGRVHLKIGVMKQLRNRMCDSPVISEMMMSKLS